MVDFNKRYERSKGFTLRSKIILLISLLIIGTGAVRTFWIFNKFNDELIRNKLTELSNETKLQGIEFSNRIEEIIRDVNFLKGTPPVQGIIRARFNDGIDPTDGSSDIIWHLRLATIFSEILRAKPEYVQVRYISLEGNGKEIVRVDRYGPKASIRIVPEPELQDKGDSGYFKNTISQEKGSIYLSPIELNRERGGIIEPIQPIIRAATPVYDTNNEPFGIIIINYDISKAFNDLINVSDVERTYYITNEKGDYLSHPDINKIFRFDYGDHSNALDDYPIFSSVLDADWKNNYTDIYHDPTTNIESAISLRTVQYNPFEPKEKIGIIAIDDINEVKAISDVVLRQAYMMIIFLISIAIMIGVWMARKLSDPILNFTQMLKEINPDDPNPVLPPHTKGEAGELAREFKKFLSEIRLKKEALRVSEERFHMVVEAIDEYAIVMLDENGCITLWNKGAERLHGYTQDEILGKHYSCFFPEEQIENKCPLEILKLAKENGSYEEEGKRVHKDGHLFIANDIITTIRSDDGEIKGFAKITRDISDRKKAEDEMRELNISLERSNQDLEQFAYIASHDLQEPLRTISSYTKILKDRFHDQFDEQSLELMQFTIDGTKRMQTLIKDLLLFSRVNAETYVEESVDLNITFLRIVEDLKSLITNSNAVITKDDLPLVQGNNTKLRQLLQNLIGNALKYQDNSRTPTVHVGVEQLNDYWQFSVRDNGIGIEKKDFQKIFTVFQRLHGKRDYSGNGIGLALCEKIVNQHEGKIWLDSVLGEGTTMFFTIPIRQTTTSSAQSNAHLAEV